MESRRLQEVKGSFLISLPREWAKRNGMKKLDAVKVTDNGISLTIKPEKKHQQSETLAWSDSTKKELVRAYLKGCESIVIRMDTKPNASEMSELKALVSSLVGVEITDESAALIELSNASGSFSLESAFESQTSLTRSMFQEVIKGNTTHLHEMLARAESYHLLVVSKSKILASAGGGESLTSARVIDYAMVSGKIRAIGDALNSIVKLSSNDSLLAGETFLHFEECVKSFGKNDAALAAELEKKREKIRPESDALKAVLSLCGEITIFA